MPDSLAFNPYFLFLCFNTCTIPSRTFLNGIIGRPIVLFAFSGGSSSLISSHKSSGIFLIAGRCDDLFESMLLDRSLVYCTAFIASSIIATGLLGKA
ncbi:MAG: hypothetical protein WCF03_19480 [Nitrososphaeraceae archaeon]